MPSHLWTIFTVGVPFCVWFVYVLILTLATVGDSETDSLFAAAALKTFTCPAGMQLFKVWEVTWHQSMLGMLKIPCVGMPTLVITSWFLSLVQLVLPQIQTFRWLPYYPALDKNEPEFEREEEAPEKVLVLGFGDRQALLSTGLDNQSIFNALSEASGLASIQNLTVTSIQMQIGSVENYFIPQKINMIVHLCSSITSRMFNTLLLENSFQINIQVTLFAVSRFITKGENHKAQIQVIASLALSILLTLCKLAEAKSFLTFAVQTQTEVLEGLEGPYSHYRTDYPHVSRGVVTLRRAIWTVRFCCIILIVTLLYAAVKLSAAFLCEDSMWNVTGCVEMNKFDDADKDV
jgi:hypothetical protein